MLLAKLDVQQLVVSSISLSSKLLGNVESNPRPYEIIRSVQGSYNQGNIALFGGRHSVLAMHYSQFGGQ